jgi:hypothetical protein
MSMREESDMADDRTDSCNHPIDPGTNLIQAFPTRAAVAEKHPSGRFRMDLFGVE